MGRLAGDNYFRRIFSMDLPLISSSTSLSRDPGVASFPTRVMTYPPSRLWSKANSASLISKIL